MKKINWKKVRTYIYMGMQVISVPLFVSEISMVIRLQELSNFELCAYLFSQAFVIYIATVFILERSHKKIEDINEMEELKTFSEALQSGKMNGKDFSLAGKDFNVLPALLRRKIINEVFLNNISIVPNNTPQGKVH